MPTNTTCLVATPWCPSTNNPPANSSNNVKMSGDDSNPPASSSTSRNLVRSGGLPNSHQPGSSLLNDDFFEQDNSTSIYTYSYHSTWSSNYTMSNLPGPGRLLGNLYSSAGSFLERRLGKLAYRASLKSFAKAKTDLDYSNLRAMLEANGVAQKEKACNILLGYASSNNPAIQVMAFAEIVRFFVRFPSLRTAAEMICQKRNEHIDVVTFSWKRPGFEYDSLWLCYYNAALRCFSMHSDSVISAIAKLCAKGYSPPLDFSNFEEILACCRDRADTRIAVEYMLWDWNGKGLDTYVKRKGYNDPVLLKLAVAYCTFLADVVTSHSRRLSTRFLLDTPRFVKKIWTSLRALKPDKADELLEDDSQLAVWTEIFKIHCILQTSPGWRLSSSYALIYWKLGVEKTWKEECHKQLPDLEHAKLRERLLQLEDIHGDAIRKRFPPAPVDEYED